MNYDGFLVINKPPGYTSHQVVAELRRVLGVKRLGHTGTLDPMATGTLVVAIGIGTKLIPYLQEERKVYRAELVLGITTNTQDLTGEIIKVHPDLRISHEELVAALQRFTGSLEQVPPMYSAVKVEGRPLYKLARAGKTIPRMPRLIKIYHLEAYDKTVDFYRFKEGPDLLIECSKGTYIRTLCHDLGESLGCGACMGGLVRLSSGVFSLEQAYSLEEVAAAKENNSLRKMLISPVEALRHLETVILKPEEVERIKHGNHIPCTNPEEELAKAVTEDGRLVAIVKQESLADCMCWQPKRVLLDP
jgi:tRNA pseudouridine55 synthase